MKKCPICNATNYNDLSKFKKIIIDIKNSFKQKVFLGVYGYYEGSWIESQYFRCYNCYFLINETAQYTIELHIDNTAYVVSINFDTLKVTRYLFHNNNLSFVDRVELSSVPEDPFSYIVDLYNNKTRFHTIDFPAMKIFS